MPHPSLVDGAGEVDVLAGIVWGSRWGTDARLREENRVCTHLDAGSLT